MDDLRRMFKPMIFMIYHQHADNTIDDSMQERLSMELL